MSSYLTLATTTTPWRLVVPASAGFASACSQAVNAAPATPMHKRIADAAHKGMGPLTWSPPRD